ncbi:hypothetical protein Agabi119p4_3360 [Agaricus bisporus var. burnettii]|uniref:MARVEL domain-containing protein n=1 Tax=Agaricus bisporus var. burnettii TaxID=192524 RepID=A0A8H7KIV7_AGABI|nr:hypothetical protein Agabi119p4_3360 [Agaricus bisporus var. burnettii]
MYSPRLDSPPPPRNLPHHRPRPWSPDNDDDLYRRREASDVSVEALDLADYARTLRTRQTDGPYPAFPSRSLDDFPYVPATRDSRDTLSPLSLVSRGPTLSSSNATSRRPFSMPSRHDLSLYHPQPRIADSQSHDFPSSSEIDISQFPAWSRAWYQSTTATNQVYPRSSSSPPIDDLYTAIPNSNLDLYNKEKKSVFDPGYIHYHEQDYDPSSLSEPKFAPPHSSESTRDVLPWNHDHDSGSPIDPYTKEERMRMLEMEFGQDSTRGKKGKGRGLGDFVDEDGKPLIGTVDTQGYLVTQGPKKRTVTRIFQILFALGAGIPAIYAAIAIKPDPPPPPAGKPQALVLYVISIITFLLLFYLFFIRPCCCNPHRKNKGAGMDNPLTGGMMVLPISSGGGGKKKNKRKEKKKSGGGGLRGGDGDVQVNLIVDPHVFSGGNDSDYDDDDDNDTDSDMPGGYYGAHRKGGERKKNQRNRRRRRRSVFTGLAMEKEWRQARGWAKKMAFVDGVGILVWGAVFIFVMIGQRCPVGKFDGWCNAYNVSTACACLLCIAFGVSVFFDVKDLYASRTSPRTRI